MAKDKDKDDKERAPRTGSVVAEDEELTLWLNKLWARNELPDRLEVWQMFGRNHVVRGSMIHHEDFAFGKKLDIEEVNRIANEIVAVCQHDCDSARRPAWYELAIIDKNRKASPLVRRVGPLEPRRQYALAKPGEAEGADDLDEALSPTALNLKHIQEGLEQVRWDKTRNDKIVGEMLFLQHTTIQDLRNQNNNMMERVMHFFERMQEAQDRSLDREMIRDKERMKQTLLKDGMRMARNLLPALFGKAGEGSGDDEPRPNPTLPGAPQQARVKDYGPSPERTLVDNFLGDVEDEEQLHVALFGDFEEADGRMRLVKPGIFSVKQFGVLVGVREGQYPVTALDDLMPQSGSELEITQEQVQAAMAAGVTDGIGMAIFELIALRQKAKEAKKKKKEEEEATP